MTTAPCDNFRHTVLRYILIMVVSLSLGQVNAYATQCINDFGKTGEVYLDIMLHHDAEAFFQARIQHAHTVSER